VKDRRCLQNLTKTKSPQSMQFHLPAHFQSKHNGGFSILIASSFLRDFHICMRQSVRQLVNVPASRLVANGCIKTRTNRRQHLWSHSLVLRCLSIYSGTVSRFCFFERAFACSCVHSLYKAFERIRLC
jgi:hypothetical protein